MKLFVACLLTSLCAAAALPAQTVTAYSTGIVLPAFLPPAGPMDPVEDWTARLNLDSGQQAGLKAIFADRESSTATLARNLEDGRRALAAAAKANSAEPEIDRLSANLAATFAQAVAMEAKAYARFYALLGADQKQKLDSLMTVPPGASVGWTTAVRPVK